MSLPLPELLPPEIARLVDHLNNHTAHPATVTRPNAATYVVEHGNDRIRLVCRYRRTSGKRWHYSSELHRDGHRIPPVTNVAAYTALLDDPDNDALLGRSAPPVFDLPEDREPPPLVTAFARDLNAQDDGYTWHIKVPPITERRTVNGVQRLAYRLPAEPDPHGYALVASGGERIMHLYFTTTADGQRCALAGMTATNEAGDDLMAGYGYDVNRAAADLLSVSLPPELNLPTAQPAVPGPRRPDTAGKASNAVTVRRVNVVRV